MARVVLIGPSDSLTALLAERLSSRIVPAPATSYEGVPAEGEVAVYRPPLAGRRDARPDLADAERFAEAFARRFAGRFAGDTARRVILLSSAAAHPPSHHNTGYLAEDGK